MSSSSIMSNGGDDGVLTVAMTMTVYDDNDGGDDHV